MKEPNWKKVERLQLALKRSYDPAKVREFERHLNAAIFGKRSTRRRRKRKAKA